MYQLLWLIPALPLAAFLLLILLDARVSRRWLAIVGVVPAGVAAVLAIILGINYIIAPPAGMAFTQKLWTWIHVGAFSPGITLYLDALTVVMAVVVTFVGFLILLYSSAYMAGDKGYHRFFAYMNLFVGSMLILVLANNLLLLYLGWEGVGFCSYVLIGFWYSDPNNGRAAMKAFIVTRIGDAALAIGLLAIFTSLGTLDIQQTLLRAPHQWPVGSAIAVAVAALLLAGAVGKSAQLPLQVWLPDAMAGPTPVSALIHAATMVTAGVYLIARTHTLFTLAPVVQSLVAVIGAVTLLLAGFSALTQWNFKRVLAYSTISQVGYMFLALGVGAWTAAIFHFVTHAFFKSLLFLAAGVVIASLHHDEDMSHMGGLHRSLPLAFWTFLVGALSLSALPLLTAGFYSKDLIIYYAWSSARGAPWLWAIAWFGAILTALYTFRMVFLVFFGEQHTKPAPVKALSISIPLIVLAVMAALAGFVELPRTFAGRLALLSDFLHSTLPPTRLAHPALRTEMILQILSEVASLTGIALAYVLFMRAPNIVRRVSSSPVGSAIERYWAAGWGFDWLYSRLFVRPYIWFAHVNRHDAIDYFYASLAWLSARFYRVLSATETGNVRWYTAGVAIGAVIVLAILVMR